jgi:hypothetical protein
MEEEEWEGAQETKAPNTDTSSLVLVQYGTSTQGGKVWY